MRQPSDWQRLDPRMLLVQPIREVGRFLPVLLGLLVAGTASGAARWWQLLAVLVPITIGVLRYLTTSYRITPARVELRRGLVSKHVLSTPLDRVRTVDLTAPLVHRVLGLATVRVGTGTAAQESGDELRLDGLPIERARALRGELLHGRAATAAPTADRGPLAEDPEGADAEPPTAERLVLRVDLAWLRYAPLTSSGIVIAAALVGAGWQVLTEVTGEVDIDASGWSLGFPLWLAAALAVLALALSISLTSMTGYLVSYWEFRLSHVPGSWHVSRGLFTTRETSIDDERLAGVTLSRPLGLRAAGAARLTAIVTGLRKDTSGTGTGSDQLVPPAPREVAVGVAGEVLGSAEPVRAPLRGHGPAARRRRQVRAVGPALLLVAAALVLLLTGRAGWWLLLPAALVLAAAVALAEDRARALGHALVGGHLVSRSGSLLRRREVLATGHVIGCNLRATWFQRRAGLTTLVATTAGGPQAVTVTDVPVDRAEVLLGGLLPDVVDQFRTGVGEIYGSA